MRNKGKDGIEPWLYCSGHFVSVSDRLRWHMQNKYADGQYNTNDSRFLLLPAIILVLVCIATDNRSYHQAKETISNCILVGGYGRTGSPLNICI